MKNNKGIILGCIASMLLFCLKGESQSFTDNFDGSSVNASLWTVVNPETDSSVSVGGGYASLENAGRLVTQSSFSSGYSIYGNFLMTVNPYSNFKVMLRTDGVSLPSPNAPSVDGIELQFNIQDDPTSGGSTTDNLKIYGPDFTDLHATANLTLDTWHTFLITDDGLNISLYFDGAANPDLTVQSSYSAGNQIAFLTREGAGNGSPISADGITQLDSISIQPIPEPSSFALCGLGGLVLLGMGKKFKAATV